MKARVTLTCQIEYDLNPDAYDPSLTDKQRLEEDLETFRRDHNVFWEVRSEEGTQLGQHIDFTGELLP